jgi:hypothetical protein
MKPAPADSRSAGVSGQAHLHDYTPAALRLRVGAPVMV